MTKRLKDARAVAADARAASSICSFYDTLDCVTAPMQPLTMEDRSRVLQQLRELICALDNRMPQIQRAGEVDIAHDAAAFRQKAVARIAELELEESITLNP